MTICTVNRRQLRPLTGKVRSDYDGDSLYGDFEIQSGQGGHTIERSSYEPGLGRFGWTSGQPDYTTERYYHSDHLGSVRGTTNFFSTWVEPMAFTAFGERITGTQNTNLTRYGYVGAYGYQAHADMPYLHVGHRYYDPSTGRFLQRDPMGIEGGLNIYAYVLNIPTIGIDPNGLTIIDGNNRVHDWVARNFWLRFHSPEWINSPGAVVEAVTISVVGGVAICAGGKFIITRLFPRPPGPPSKIYYELQPGEIYPNTYHRPWLRPPQT